MNEGAFILNYLRDSKVWIYLLGFVLLIGHVIPVVNQNWPFVGFIKIKTNVLLAVLFLMIAFIMDIENQLRVHLTAFMDAGDFESMKNLLEIPLNTRYAKNLKKYNEVIEETYNDDLLVEEKE